MDCLKIEFETGRMVLNVREFFPTTDKKIKKVAKLINRYCSDEARAELLSELRNMEEQCREDAEKYKSMASTVTKKHEGKLLAQQARVCEARRKRLERDRKNIEGRNA